jgi:hypothetical protein
MLNQCPRLKRAAAVLAAVAFKQAVVAVLEYVLNR